MSFFKSGVIGKIEEILSGEIDTSILNELSSEEIASIEVAPEIAIPIIIADIALSRGTRERIADYLQKVKTGNVLNDQEQRYIKNGKRKIDTTVKRTFEMGDPKRDPAYAQRPINDGGEDVKEREPLLQKPQTEPPTKPPTKPPTQAGQSKNTSNLYGWLTGRKTGRKQVTTGPAQASPLEAGDDIEAGYDAEQKQYTGTTGTTGTTTRNTPTTTITLTQPRVGGPLGEPRQRGTSEKEDPYYDIELGDPGGEDEPLIKRQARESSTAPGSNTAKALITSLISAGIGTAIIVSVLQDTMGVTQEIAKKIVDDTIKDIPEDTKKQRINNRISQILGRSQMLGRKGMNNGRQNIPFSNKFILPDSTKSYNTVDLVRQANANANLQRHIFNTTF